MRHSVPWLGLPALLALSGCNEIIWTQLGEDAQSSTTLEVEVQDLRDRNALLEASLAAQQERIDRLEALLGVADQNTTLVITVPVEMSDGLSVAGPVAIGTEETPADLFVSGDLTVGKNVWTRSYQKTGGTDFVGAFDQLDAQVAEIRTDLGTKKASEEDAFSRIVLLEGRQLSLRADVDTLRADTNALRVDVDTHDDWFGAYDLLDGTVHDRLGDLESATTLLGGRVTTLEGQYKKVRDDLDLTTSDLRKLETEHLDFAAEADDRLTELEGQWITSSKTIALSGSKICSDLQDAMYGLRRQHFAPGIKVTITVPSGTHTCPGALDLGHPQGDQIEILGTGNPILKFASTGVIVANGLRLGLVNGLTLQGSGTVAGSAGVSVSSGGFVGLGSSLKVYDFGYGVQAYLGSLVVMDGVEVLRSLTKGIDAELGSVVRARGAETSATNGDGVYALGGSVVDIGEMTSAGNNGSGFFAVGGSSLVGHSADASDSSSGFGLAAGSSLYLSGRGIALNTYGAAVLASEGSSATIRGGVDADGRGLNSGLDAQTGSAIQVGKPCTVKDYWVGAESRDNSIILAPSCFSTGYRDFLPTHTTDAYVNSTNRVY
jgi:hypothetical protein